MPFAIDARLKGASGHWSLPRRFDDDILHVGAQVLRLTPGGAVLLVGHVIDAHRTAGWRQRIDDRADHSRRYRCSRPDSHRGLDGAAADPVPSLVQGCRPVPRRRPDYTGPWTRHQRSSSPDTCFERPHGGQAPCKHKATVFLLSARPTSRCGLPHRTGSLRRCASSPVISPTATATKRHFRCPN